MMRVTLSKIALLAFVGVPLVAVAQQRPSSANQYPPNPPANHVEVHFAMGKQTVTCKHFKLTIKGGEQTILTGTFASGFSIPPAALTSPDKLDITLQCGERKWHFPEVLPQAFRQGWWWVGTDYPPFQELLQNDESLKDALWVKYLIVDPIGGEPFYTYKFCPTRLKDQKPGPCYTD
jgi:hypothetical protein